VVGDVYGTNTVASTWILFSKQLRCEREVGNLRNIPMNERAEKTFWKLGRIPQKQGCGFWKACLTETMGESHSSWRSWWLQWWMTTVDSTEKRILLESGTSKHYRKAWVKFYFRMPWSQAGLVKQRNDARQCLRARIKALFDNYLRVFAFRDCYENPSHL